MNIRLLGWNDFFEANFAPYMDNSLSPARVARRDRTSWLLYHTEGETVGELSGKFRREITDTSAWPAVGDWVAVSPEGDGAPCIIHAVLPRQSCLSRKAASSGGMPDSGGRTDEQVLAANIDTAFLVSGLDLDFNIRRLERYLATAYDCGARPVVVLNKSDLCQDVESVIAEVESVAVGVDILTISATEGTGLEQMDRYIEGNQTIVLLGSSGVGKSTIINRLIGSEALKTAPVRESDNRGRHTTTWREMIPLPSGGVLIDSPGMRELQAWINEDSLKRTFDDIEALAKNCRFRDCRHQGEPGCAVEAAVAEGELDLERLDSFHKLKKEMRFLEERRSGKAARMDRVRGRQMASRVKEVNKMNKKRH